MSQTLEQIALRVADTAGLDNPQEFLACVKQVVAALGAQEPVAWRVVTKTTTGFSCWINYYDFGAAGSPLNNDGTWKEKHCHHWQFNDSPSKQLQLVSVEKLYAAPQLSQPLAERNQPDLVWLYTHCKAIGMDCKSDSGKISHDICLYTINQKQRIEQLETTLPQREGWQCVPKDYTYAMHQAWLEGNSFDERYKAMLAAAPKL